MVVQSASSARSLRSGSSRGRLYVAIAAAVALGGAGTAWALVPAGADTKPDELQASLQPMSDELFTDSESESDSDEPTIVAPHPSIGKAPEPQPEPAPEPKPEADAPQPLPKPPGKDATRRERIAHAKQVVERLSDRALERAQASAPIEDGFGRQVGRTAYPEEKESDRPLRLNAIVNPQGEPPFATIEHQDTGFVGSYAEGTMLRPGVLPGVWIVDIEPGVVHLLDLESNRYEFLTFEEPPKRRVSRAEARRRARAARKRANERKRRNRKKR